MSEVATDVSRYDLAHIQSSSSTANWEILFIMDIVVHTRIIVILANLFPPQGLTCFTALSQFPVFKSTVTLLLYFFPFLMISHNFSPFNNQNPFLAQCGASPAVLLRLVLLSDWETDGNREEKIYLNKFKTPRREDFYTSYIVSKGQRLENLPRGFISHHREADRHTAVAWTDSLKMCEWIKSDKYTLCHRFMQVYTRGEIILRI